MWNTESEILANDDGTYTVKVLESGLDKVHATELRDLIEHLIGVYQNNLVHSERAATDGQQIN